MSDCSSKPKMVVDEFIAPVCREHVEILYQDDDILVINKPSGLLSLSGKNPANWDSVHYRLVHGQPDITAAFPTAKLIHRLDFGTSGIMVVGLNPESTKHLNKQFQAGTIKKHYIAILDGWLLNDAGQINAAIAKDKSLFPLVKICNVMGKVAVSDYSVLKRLTSPQRTLVQFTPVTGRTHQLRIHSHSIGHPILGCDLYKNESSEQLAERLQLHASDLFFVHPQSLKNIHFHCSQPFS
ncbi:MULTISPECIES: RluA family pseudouridine synthase [Pseudoalteromonas]|uniref:RluA family pseudouridine synthase n=1 Tax=Pseudoalteromonas TaxID=53246 RepID=UPI0002DDF4E6|nr:MULTISPECIES: RluA family pseudouridine synthase [Pseudoalteromonas]MCF6142586.1 tRNA pseudouridine32 synthase / 23S rRNA pseudouridine746 synthase [Pseudoalteromonas mariniglutinosa NCIMB 1770]TMN70053.1 RluA family pseudouridine synthase [Pseudoalteromonas sp. S1727]BDF94664.1 RNA pseudouridine synthase [Pseudoalteromonas sp. KAN5]